MCLQTTISKECVFSLHRKPVKIIYFRYKNLFVDSDVYLDIQAVIVYAELVTPEQVVNTEIYI